MKKSAKVAVHLTLLLLYFLPPLIIFYIPEGINRLRFEMFDLRHEMLNFRAKSDYSTILNGYRVKLERNPKWKTEGYKLELFIDGDRLESLELKSRSYYSEVYIINVDGDSYKEIYFYDFEGPYNLLDLYKEGERVAYRGANLAEDSKMAWRIYHYRYKSRDREADKFFLLAFGVILSLFHLAILTLYIIVKKIQDRFL